MAAWQHVVSLAQQFQKNVEHEKLSAAESQLKELKEVILELDSLPPIGLETPNAAQERILFAQVLEHAVILSIHQKDKSAFQKYITSLRPYYTQYGIVDSSPSNITYTVIGLNLLYLLVENRLADFHCELELLSSNSRNHPNVLFCTQLEKHLVVGAYDSVLTAAAQPPVQLYSFFLVSLLETVRINIGECLAAAYTTIAVNSATQLLMFNNPQETLAFVQENYPDWQLQGDRIIISGEVKIKKATEIQSLGLISQTLSYAVELDRIVRSKFRKSFVVKDETEGVTHKTKRQDTCIVILSGVVGTDAQEFYLRDGHYRQIFPLGITSYFNPIFDSEKENSDKNTLWIPSEAFDDLAKDNISLFQKGRIIHAVGTLLCNHWIDKATGEDRKQLRFRVTKILKAEDFEVLKRILSTETFTQQTEKVLNSNHKEAAENPTPAAFSRSSQKYSSLQVSDATGDAFVKQDKTSSPVSSYANQNKKSAPPVKQNNDENSLPPTIRRSPLKGKLPTSPPKPAEVTQRTIEQPYEEMEVISFGASESINASPTFQPKHEDAMMSSLKRTNTSMLPPIQRSMNTSDSWDILEQQLHMFEESRPH